MTNYLLYWDNTAAGFAITVKVTPDSGVSVMGYLTITTNGRDVGSELTFNDLVPQWTHTLSQNQTVHMTLLFDYHTEAPATVHVVAQCLDASGNVYEPRYTEAYTGDRTHPANPLVSAL